MVKLSPPLFCNTRPVPVRPVTVPPMEKDEVEPGVPLQPYRTAESISIRIELVKAFRRIVALMLAHLPGIKCFEACSAAGRREGNVKFLLVSQTSNSTNGQVETGTLESLNNCGSLMWRNHNMANG